MPTPTGLGIRPELFADIELRKPPVGFLEAHSENYFGYSIARSKLLALREEYPVSLHGVGLSLGRADDLDRAHLQQLRSLIDQVEPMLVSEHLAWSAYSHRQVPDLLPLPLHSESLDIICQHIEQMQETLGCQVLIENPSNYLLFEQLQIPETEFLNTLARRTGCGLLLDINNIEVSARNLQRSAREYLLAIDGDAIGQYHLAGHTAVSRANETLLIDTHNQPVSDSVWALYELALKTHGDRPALLEWDSDFPAFDVLLNECAEADRRRVACPQPERQIAAGKSTEQAAVNALPLAELQQQFLDQTLNGAGELAMAVAEHRPRIAVYQHNVQSAVEDYLREVYPAIRGVVGAQFFAQMVRRFLVANPPDAGNINVYGGDFAGVIAEFPGLAEMPYLYDLAAYEWALHLSYFADPGVGLAHTEIPQDQLLRLPIRLNPSVHFLESLYPVFEIHRQSLPDYAGDVKIDLGQSQDSLLVCKLGAVVHSQLLQPAQALWLRSLADADTLLQAIEVASGSLPVEEISTSLSLVFELGLLSSADG